MPPARPPSSEDDLGAELDVAWVAYTPVPDSKVRSGHIGGEVIFEGVPIPNIEELSAELDPQMLTDDWNLFEQADVVVVVSKTSQV